MTVTPQNSDTVWDAVWDTEQDDVCGLKAAVARDLAIMCWPEFMAAARARLGVLSGLSSVELGAGRGTASLQLAKMGVHVTLVDWSERALATASQIFEREGFTPTLVKCDILRLPEHLHGRFDLAISVGVAEHFVGDDRRDVIRAHAEVLKPGGLALISVPNSCCPPYRVAKYLSEKRGKWRFGLEVPFSRRELNALADASGLEVVTISGSPLPEATIHWLLRPYARTALVKLIGENLTSRVWPVANRPVPDGPATYLHTPLDSRWGYLYNLVAARHA